MAHQNELPASIKHRKIIERSISHILKMYSSISTFLQHNETSPLDKAISSQRVLMIALIGLSNRRTTLWTEALQYFFGQDWVEKANQFGVPDVMPPRVFEKLIHGLVQLIDTAEFEILLPYIVEGFEYAVADEEEVTGKKKAKGIYYTPHDVVTYLVDGTLGAYLEECTESTSDTNTIQRKMRELSILDPACGSGVFLLECLDRLVRFHMAFGRDPESILEMLSPLYGVDISPIAVDSCRFMLTYRLLKHCGLEVVPHDIWRLVSTNILQADSMFTPARSHGLYPEHTGQEPYHPDGTTNPTALPILSGMRSFEHMFPGVFAGGSGFKIIIGNPPYASLNLEQRKWLNQLGYASATYPSLPSNTHMVFIEKMLELADPIHARCSFVVPLSIAYDRGKNMIQLRKLIESTAGEWKFAHFDRSPDSLFGDHVKTRNTILFFNRNPHVKEMYTSQLHRWNSRQRQSLFRNIDYVKLPEEISAEGIPRIGGKLGLDIYLHFKKLAKLDADTTIRYFVSKAQIEQASMHNRIYAYGTAYNWIPVFRELPRSWDENGQPYVPSGLWIIQCDSPQSADMLYACLSSRYCYLLWIMLGDGFHFSPSILSKLPFHRDNFTKAQIETLSHLGRKLNYEAQRHVTRSHNAGKIIGNYDMIECDTILKEVDMTLTNAFDFSDEHLKYVETAHHNHIRAGRTIFKHVEMLVKA